MAKTKSADGDTVVIKKYANRRLYNTATSSYVTLDDLCDMVKDGVEFVVYDARNDEDITRSVLTQIIFEQEAKGNNLLPISFLRQLIGYYDDRLHAVVPHYLEATMEAFARNQEQIRQQMEQAFGDFLPVRQLQELGQQNMAMFRDALSMFSPLGEHPNVGSETSPKGGGEDASMDALKRQVELIQARLDALSRKEE
ncbi:MAG TPA: polyhydroxyalkanoate synthesis repressor PhaR [Alphaproteobacteria bacterium]|jgi:polyhydroxyalkanoate synthesis repressor PhaR|nr:polyhydroxyalkanoate synthesis repressor PhaR [Alphaproteobacteria bacterium]